MPSQTYKQKAERPDFTAVLVDPGWVKTGEPAESILIALYIVLITNMTAALGGEGAQLEPEFSASNVIKLITSLSNEDSGKFFRYDGSTIPW